jgi:beta-glucanase (GH16 family)
MRKLLHITIAIIAILANCGFKKIDPGYTNLVKWKLIWSDEFNYKGHPDPSKWEYEEAYYRRPIELQYYTVNRLENARVDGKNLIIELRKETPESFYPTSLNDEWHRYTSAAVNTRNTAYWKYGRFEIRAKLPKGSGTWPAIWFLSPIRTADIPGPHKPRQADGTVIPFPKRGPGGGESSQGEIDLMESWGSRPNRTYTYIHGTKGPNPSARYEHPRDIYNEFFIYAMEWYQDSINFFRDDVKILHYPKDPSTGWSFDKPLYLIMNIACGGPDEPAPEDSNLPTSMVVDYVRVYELKK